MVRKKGTEKVRKKGERDAQITVRKRNKKSRLDGILRNIFLKVREQKKEKLKHNIDGEKEIQNKLYLERKQSNKERKYKERTGRKETQKNRQKRTQQTYTKERGTERRIKTQA